MKKPVRNYNLTEEEELGKQYYVNNAKKLMFSRKNPNTKFKNKREQ